MIAVFLGFVAGDDPTTKMFGLGLATAISLDVTIVRMVLVPATHVAARRRQLVAAPWLDRILPGAGRTVRSRVGAPRPPPSDPAPQSR